MTDRHISSVDLAPPTMVSDRLSFSAMMTHLRQQSLLALDTESDSLFSYYPKVCLIQISVCDQDTVCDYLLDPLAIDEIAELNSVLVNPDIEVIMHAAYNDILTLQREYHFSFNQIFDTQLTARILGWKRTGLAAVLEEHFGIISDKKMQRTNWGQRPLTERQQSYAQMDTHYLFELRRIQLEQLDQLNRVEEAREAFQGLERINFHERPVQERSFWQMRTVRNVPSDRMGVLKALWHWRERKAQKLDRPPFKVINDPVLTQIAVAAPQEQGELHQVKGLSQHQVRRFGKSLLRTVRKGLEQPAPRPPTFKGRPQTLLDEDTVQRYEALRSWRTKKAEDRGVDPDIVFSNDTLLAIAKRAPQSPAALREISDIGPWKAKTYGPDVCDVIANHGAPVRSPVAEP